MNRLLYIWIDNYKSISKQGFNLTSDYNISFDGETLTIEDNDSYIPNFFSLEPHENSGRVSEITALIGGNGSGKSTLISYIIETFFTGKNSELNSLIIYKI